VCAALAQRYLQDIASLRSNGGVSDGFGRCGAVSESN
jgi:hypothetical protein